MCDPADDASTELDNEAVLRKFFEPDLAKWTSAMHARLHKAVSELSPERKRLYQLTLDGADNSQIARFVDKDQDDVAREVKEILAHLKGIVRADADA